jgi:hypothetical protein
MPSLGPAPSADVVPAPAPPAAEPAPAAPPQAPPNAPAAPAPKALEPPPPPPALDPPPAPEPSSRPSFLKTRDELERAVPEREQPRRRRLDAESDAPPARAGAPLELQKALPRDFVLNATPWVDFTLTSFWMGDRTDNFLNLGVQAGGYVFERLRLSGRLIVPLEEASDQYTDYGSFSSPGATYERVPSRSVSVLYGLSAGLILSNSRTFLFAPGLTIWRTDVNDYGTTGAITLPFEWTTSRRLRVGFELALGHSFGGSQDRACKVFTTAGSSCGTDEVSRPGSTAVLLQYHMGWALSGL